MTTIQDSNGNHTIINTKDKWIKVNGVTYFIPYKIKCNNVTQIDGQIFIDGYEFKNGKFKHSLKALFHLFF